VLEATGFAGCSRHDDWAEVLILVLDLCDVKPSGVVDGTSSLS